MKRRFGDEQIVGRGAQGINMNSPAGPTQCVFIANFGYRNNQWASCLEDNVILTMNDVDTHPFWEVGDKDGFIQYCVANKHATSGKAVGRATASRWYNLMTIISQSAHDIWIHRQDENLWWTETLNEDPTIQQELDPEPNPGFPEYIVCRKPCKPWQKVDRKGRPLPWGSIHPKAQFFLRTEATLQQLQNENPTYALSLMNGEELDYWHNKIEWKQVLQEKKKSPPKSFTPEEKSVLEMIFNARNAERVSGTQLTTTAKDKEVRFANDTEFETFLRQKLLEQEGLCALTNIPLEYLGSHGDKDYLCSLDRIDSDGHYERDNLQIVCRFVNFWKSERDNAKFLANIELIKVTP